MAKGDKNCECNRRACNNAPAIHFNRSTEKFYCTPCARKINSYPENENVCAWPTRADLNQDGTLK